MPKQGTMEFCNSAEEEIVEGFTNGGMVAWWEGALSRLAQEWSNIGNAEMAVVGNMGLRYIVGA